jgi:hypothetical protein
MDGALSHFNVGLDWLEQSEDLSGLIRKLNEALTIYMIIQAVGELHIDFPSVNRVLLRHWVKEGLDVTG